MGLAHSKIVNYCWPVPPLHLFYNPSLLFSAQFGGLDVSNEGLTAEEIRARMTEGEWERLYTMSQDKNLYQNLISSLFPTIHGNDEVKRGVLLMLFGGVPKITTERTHLRGDINVCIVGDPSTAKSQILKYGGRKSQRERRGRICETSDHISPFPSLPV